MLDYPRLREPVLYSILAAIVVIVAIKGEELPDWIRLFFVALGVIFTSAALITLLNWLTFIVTERINDFQQARIRPVLLVSDAIKGLGFNGLQLVSRFDHLEILGTLGSTRPLWNIKGLTQDIPLEFVSAFLFASQDTYPLLHPVRESDRIRDETGANFMGHENLATDLTNIICSMGWAEKATGNRPAKALISQVELAKRLGLED